MARRIPRLLGVEGEPGVPAPNFRANLLLALLLALQEAGQLSQARLSEAARILREEK